MKMESIRFFRVIFFCALTAGLLPSVVSAQSVPAESGQSAAIWDAIKIFEGNHTTVTGDFDCQGISIGVAQWNLGKSYPAVKSIVLAVDESERRTAMPRYGHGFAQALRDGRSEALVYVRALQHYSNAESCDSAVRKAAWTADGKIFRAELSALLSGGTATSAQRDLRKPIFESGWRNAQKWARARRGSDAVPTQVEVAYFVDMQIFNGGGFEKFGVSYAPYDREEADALILEVIAFLRDSNESFLLHKIAARKNAVLLQPARLEDSERDLFIQAYRVAIKLNANYSRQFRLTTINRRAAILFGKAFYSDRDQTPITIRLRRAEH